MAAPPKAGLGFFPTPFHRLSRLSGFLADETGQAPDWWVKRDDQTGLATGGNKVRKLEYLLADALAQGANTVVAGGGLQSNFARLTAAACTRLGLRCVLALHPGFLDDADYTRGGNVLLDELLGAGVRVYPGMDSDGAIQAAAAELRAEGCDPYVIPLGGSTPLGSLGYVDAVAELGGQLDGSPPDLIAVAAGSYGTMAGIVAGVAAQRWPTRVIGMCVCDPADVARTRIQELLNGLAGFGYDADGVTWDVVDHCFGDGYGAPTDGMLDAVRLLARTEGILLDPVYTGKTMAGLLTELRAGRLAEMPRVVFWHTGGAPGLFAYRVTLEGAF
ncbi:MAG: D-cysteine desulfhydrase family protein [Micrococcales bacterium]|nr:D-cysteine desulfhydrase family protein [Micrococcales bacterium]